MLKRIKQALFRPAAPHVIRVGSREYDSKLLIPVIKGTGLIKTGPGKIHMQGLPEDDIPLRIDLTGDLAVLFAINLPDRLEYLSNKAAHETGLSSADLFDFAKKNLAHTASTIRIVQDGTIGFQIQFDGNLESSLLMYDDLWDHFKNVVGGDPIIVVPHRSTVFGCSARSEGAIDYLLSKVNDFDPNTRHAVSRNLFIRQEKRWRVHTH